MGKGASDGVCGLIFHFYSDIAGFFLLFYINCNYRFDGFFVIDRTIAKT